MPLPCRTWSLKTIERNWPLGRNHLFLSLSWWTNIFKMQENGFFLVIFRHTGIDNFQTYRDRFLDSENLNNINITSGMTNPKHMYFTEIECWTGWKLLVQGTTEPGFETKLKTMIRCLKLIITFSLGCILEKSHWSCIKQNKYKFNLTYILFLFKSQTLYDPFSCHFETHLFDLCKCRKLPHMNNCQLFIRNYTQHTLKVIHEEPMLGVFPIWQNQSKERSQGWERNQRNVKRRLDHTLAEPWRIIVHTHACIHRVPSRNSW